MTIRSLSVGPLGTNCYIVWGENGVAAVIDPGDEASRIMKTLDENGLVCKAVLLTHAHFDHMAALDELVKASGAVVYCHRAEQAALTDGKVNLSSVFGMFVPPVKTATLLDEGDTVTVGELLFTVLHTPGHTVGSCCYRIGDTLFSGDTLFCESIGRTDFPGGSIHQMRASLSRLLAMDDIAHVYPGHDEPTTIAHEREYNPFV